MTNTNRPPRIADWFLNLFVPKDQAPPILGDLREEFSILTSRRGLSSAYFWYWRQVAKTIPHLFYAELVLEPWQTLASLITGLVLLWLANMPIAVTWNYYPSYWPEPCGSCGSCASPSRPSSFRPRLAVVSSDGRVRGAT
jgi:hypothetical protein